MLQCTGLKFFRLLEYTDTNEIDIVC